MLKSLNTFTFVDTKSETHIIMLHRILFLGTLFSATFFSVNAQNAISDKAEKLVELHAYRNAATEFEKINTTNPLSAKDALMWAQSLTKVGETSKALSIYKFLNNSNRLTDSSKVAYFDALLFDGNYATAEQVANSVQNGFISAHLKSRSEWLANNKNNTKIAVKNLLLNSAASEFGIAMYKNNLVWSSDRNDISRSKSLGSKKDWTGSSNNQMFVAQKTNNTISNIQFFLNDLKNVYNEGFPSFTADGKTVAFMRSNINDGKRLLSNSGIEMSIYLADVDDNGNWMNTRPFTNNAAATGFPSLSPDGKSLYFVSDRSGGFGGFDIYKSMRIGSGWSEPRNLGESINTTGDEITPSSDGENLFFASTQHNGFGGFDIFKVPLSNLSNVENMGAGINSAQDDYGYISNGASGEAYFVSNRVGGKGREDIYSSASPLMSHKANQTKFLASALVVASVATSTVAAPAFLAKQIPKAYSAEVVKGKNIYAGNVVNGTTNEKLDGVTVTLMDNTSKKRAQSLTDSAGGFTASLKNSGNYTISFYKEGFAEKKMNLKGAALKANKLPDVQLVENSEVVINVPAKQTTPPAIISKEVSPQELKNSNSFGDADVLTKSPDAPKKEKFYAIQLASSKDKFTDYLDKKNEKLTAPEYIIEEKGNYKVRLGVFNSKIKADSVLKIVHTSSYTNAFVVVEKNDSIIKKYLIFDAPIPKAYTVEVVKKNIVIAADTTYKIQLGAYKNPKNFNDDKVSGVWKIESKKEGILTIFYMDGIKKLENAKQLKKRVQDAGFADAKIVKVDGDKWRVVD